MKAGIYKRRDNGKHIYVAKDRSIRAYQMTDCLRASHAEKVKTSHNGQIATLDDGLVLDRVADVPNGVTDHVRALQGYIERFGVVKDKSGRKIGVLSEPLEVLPTDTDMLKMLTGKSERVVGKPRELGMGYGPDALIDSAVAIREANAGVPPHVAQKIVSNLPRFTAEHILVQSASATLADEEMEGYLAIAEERGIISRVCDEIVIHDEHRYKAFMDRVLKRNPHIAENEVAARLSPPSFSVPLARLPMPKAMKRHGAVGAVAYSQEELAVLKRVISGELRIIGKQSKRKHRKAGHRVFWCVPLGSWVWEVVP